MNQKLLFGKTGVDVMLTFFGFFGFKKLAFFSNNNVMIKFLQKGSVLSQKNANFLPNFLAKFFLKIITSVPRLKPRRHKIQPFLPKMFVPV
jgi:hypothetical protein